MANLMDVAGQRRLSEFFDRIGQVLGRKGRRESFALYAEGIFGDGESKSIEPIAAGHVRILRAPMQSISGFFISRSMPHGATTMFVWRRRGTRSRR